MHMGGGCEAAFIQLIVLAAVTVAASLGSLLALLCMISRMGHSKIDVEQSNVFAYMPALANDRHPQNTSSANAIHVVQITTSFNTSRVARICRLVRKVA
jgi:hypothetical protein